MSDPGYEYELVYMGSIKEKTREGWEPAPGMNSVLRYIGTTVQTFVWLRRVRES